MSTTVKAESNESFNYVGAGWWKSSGYDSQRVKGRLVLGDFDGNGKDDIAALYDYGVEKLQMGLIALDLQVMFIDILLE
jgi:hypothetical protein